MKQQHTPTLKPIKPGLYYLDYTDCAKINVHDDLVAEVERLREALVELRICSRAKIGREDDFACADVQTHAALAKAKASA